MLGLVSRPHYFYWTTSLTSSSLSPFWTPFARIQRRIFPANTNPNSNAKRELLCSFQICFTERRLPSSRVVVVDIRDDSSDVQQVIPEADVINGQLAPAFEPPAAEFGVLVVVLWLELGDSQHEEGLQDLSVHDEPEADATRVSIRRHRDDRRQQGKKKKLLNLSISLKNDLMALT